MSVPFDSHAGSIAEPSVAPASRVRSQLSATERLVEVAQELSMARDLEGVMAVVRRAARELTRADGATFVLRDDDLCFYADEDAITPLWKGRRFPMSSCISGWAMLNREAAIIEDIYADPRIPHDAYRPTFVKSLAMVPIRTAAPVGAIGNYWAEHHRATDGEVKLLRALADLTSVAMENVQLYGELEKRIREAQDAVRARDEFITVAAHELRTPLTSLQLCVESIEELAAPNGTPSDGRAPIAARASRAVASAKRLGALVDGLLDVSRLTSAAMPLHLEDLDLAETVTGVARRLEDAARRAGCTVEVDAPVPVRGRWDRTRIEELITSLLSNALKYGSGKPVRIALERDERVARLKVCDVGAGIAPEHAPRIFERFGRAGSINNAGLGLGLYLARRIVEAHGGTIRYVSKPDEGCTFVVEMPLTIASQG